MTTTTQSLESIATNTANIAKEISQFLESQQKGVDESKVKSLVKNYVDSSTKVNYSQYIATNSNATRNGRILPVLYLSGDVSGMLKENKVDLSYKYKPLGTEIIEGTCNCKWQGNSSINWPKKNYTINKLSVPMDLGWGNQKKYVLKADYNDSSLSRNNVAAKLWGKIIRANSSTDIVIQKLKAMPNCGAIDGFHCMLVINDVYQGIYNFNIPKDKWMMGMGDGQQEAIVVADGYSLQTAFKEVVTKEQVTVEDTNFALEYATNEDNIDWVVDSLNSLISSCIVGTEIEYREQVVQKISLDAIIDYYIHACVTGNWDGIRHNYLLGILDSGKWFFIPYDLDLTFGIAFSNLRYINPSKVSPTFAGYINEHNLAKMIYKYDRLKLKNRYQELRNTVLSEDNVNNILSTYMTDMPKLLLDEEFRLWPKRIHSGVEQFAYITEWYRLRCEYLDKEVESWNV